MRFHNSKTVARWGLEDKHTAWQVTNGNTMSTFSLEL